MELSSSDIHPLSTVLLTAVLIVGAFVYGGMYFHKRRPNWQPTLANGPAILSRETVLRGNTKLDLIVARDTALSRHREMGHRMEV